MKGYVHSVESCGTVDGPGIRYIVFMQGCLLRCQYCHNADTWNIGAGKEMTVDEIVEEAKAYKAFMDASGGGITISGGEPLLQAEFVTEVFKRCKEEGIHTTLDTSGGCFDSSNEEFMKHFDELMAVTDLLLVDIKQIDSKKHRKLTGKPNEHILEFVKYLSDRQKPIWIRHVLVPERTDAEEDLRALRAFIDTLSNVEKVEVLPYHKLGVYKWKTLGLKYPLEDIESPTEESVIFANEILGSAT
ncbi:pyruvate formate-lyase-activating enzyme [Priestia taiwanensis]|uniref:Pyruvate formate-lyase-activating enzyme n=2 Tax=Priestia taiwanensis TaxID=1347902 RepID=A0A917ETH3_9BACI|nr:pyruvate formate-lyase-activating enzyme [Priestia taiwanensis]